MLCLKNDILLITGFLRIFMDTRKSAKSISPLYSFITPSFTWKAGLNYTGVKLDYMAADKLRLLLENNLRGETSFVFGNYYVE